MFSQNWYPRETSLLLTGRQMLCSMSVRKSILFLHSGITILTGSLHDSLLVIDKKPNTQNSYCFIK